MKYLAHLLIISAFVLHASQTSVLQQEPAPRLSVKGCVVYPGVTFATKRDAEEAIERGRDPRNPFVGDVFKLNYTPKQGLELKNPTRRSYSVITLIASNNIFLGCRHATTCLLDAIHSTFFMGITA